MAVTSADVINSLNEHLILVLQELHLKEDIVQRMEDAVDAYKRKFALIRHQQGLLYNDYITDKRV
jgi:centrosomal protein CEP290